MPIFYLDHSRNFCLYYQSIIVFKSKNQNKFNEFIKFTGSRVTTLLVEIAFLYLLIDLINFDEFWSKVIGQIVVLILNYVLSKLLVFKTKK